MDKLSAISNVIEMRLKGLGMSKQQFAKEMSTQPSSVTKWLSGKHNFTIETLFKIEEVLNIRIIYPVIYDQYVFRSAHAAHSI